MKRACLVVLAALIVCTISAPLAAQTTVKVVPGEPFETQDSIPAAVSGRPYVSVRFDCDDYAYVGELMRDCRCLELQRLALE